VRYQGIEFGVRYQGIEFGARDLGFRELRVEGVRGQVVGFRVSGSGFGLRE